MMYFLPVVYAHGKRYRTRLRFLAWRGFHFRRESFTQGDVIRIWLGVIYLCVMVDHV